jgi:hypothetical protein
VLGVVNGWALKANEKLQNHVCIKKNYGFGFSWMADFIGVRNMKNLFFGYPWDGRVYVKKKESK